MTLNESCENMLRKEFTKQKEKGTIYMFFLFISGVQFLDLCYERKIELIRKKLVDKSCESNVKYVDEEEHV